MYLTSRVRAVGVIAMYSIAIAVDAITVDVITVDMNEIQSLLKNKFTIKKNMKYFTLNFSKQ